MLNHKLKELQYNLKNNNISDKKSACFGVLMILIIYLFTYLSMKLMVTTMSMVVFVVLNAQQHT